jgi:hypothetical protein
MIVFTFTVLVFLVLRFTVTLFNFLSNPKLSAFRPAFASSVSIVIMLRNEESNLLNLLDSIKLQDFSNFEVFICYNEMEQHDEETVAQFCSQDARFSMLKGYLNDYSWVESRAKGNYLMLLDSNTFIQAGLLNSLIYRIRIFKLGIISVIPTQVVKGFRQQLLVPLSDFMLLNMVPLRLVRLFKTQVLSVPSRDCLFMDAEKCFSNQWLERIDPRKGPSELLRMVKQDQEKAEVLLGNTFVYKRPKHNDAEALSTAAEHLKLYFNGNLLVAFLYVFLVVLGPLIVLIGFDIKVLVLPIGLIFLSRVMTAFLTRQNPVYTVLTHPLQMAMLLVIYVKALSKQLLTSGKQKSQ